MVLIPNLAINILSGHLKPKARKRKLLFIITIIAFLLLPYPLNRLLGESTISLVIFCIIIGLVVIFAAIFKYGEKFETIGRIVFNSNRVTIKVLQETKPFEIKNIKRMDFEFNGYWDQPFKYGPKMRTENGNENYITIKTSEEIMRYELFLESSKMLKALTDYLNYFNNNGVKTNITQINYRQQR